MKSTIKYLALFLISITLVSCGKKDTDEDENYSASYRASYELKIDGSIISSNTSVEFQFVLDTSGDANLINVVEPDDLFHMGFTNIPTEVGSTISLSDDEDILIAMTGHRLADASFPVQVFIDTGTMTRTASDRVSFTGVFSTGGAIHNATGFIKSDGISQ